ncbi:hypothetical protein HHK36_021682 [Tetracentron sinense]|uniref:RNA-dependent RNA polymerase n=1 Tax=Tetracentron sinense TaxID=13715 RepID=A0A835D7A7_TETSI|nr:hypothetical protein HHK36_021682 [Tetracentron sinense]
MITLTHAHRRVGASKSMVVSRRKEVLSWKMVKLSNKPKKTYLSRFLIALLSYGGVPKEYFMDVLTDSLDNAQKIHFNKRAALKEERKGLKGGKIPVSECYYLMGTADPTGLLSSDEVCIILDNGQITGKVLVYKHPGLHFGDIHVLTATYVKEMENIVGNAKYAIFFPTKGPRSLADEIANSDFDGDMYWVSQNPQILNCFQASIPWKRTYSANNICNRKPTEFSDEELENELFEQFLTTRFQPSETIGVAADSWLAYMDRLLALGDQYASEKDCVKEKMLRLIDIYYDALDAPKTGMKVEVPNDLKADKFPHFMERTNSYVSTSILGLIYDKVVSIQTENPSSEGNLCPIYDCSCFDKKMRYSDSVYEIIEIAYAGNPICIHGSQI